MTREEFEGLVGQAIESLPKEFAKQMENVEVTVEEWPTPDDLRSVRLARGMTLFGLYRGIPKTNRENYNAVLPDKIIIFAGPILSSFGQDPQLIKEQVRKTVVHEVGHHFGMTDEEIRRTGY